MTSNLSDEIAAFVSQELGVRLARLTREARLAQDLGVDGTDGWEFMAAFGNRFEVDMAEFQAGLHFGPEAGGNPLVWFWWFITRSWPKHIPITLLDLEDAVRVGRWETPHRPAV